MKKEFLIHDALISLMQLLEEAGITPVAISVMTEEETYVLMGGQHAS